VIFQDFPGPVIFKKKIQDLPVLSRRCGNPDNSAAHSTALNIAGEFDHQCFIATENPAPYSGYAIKKLLLFL